MTNSSHEGPAAKKLRLDSSAPAESRPAPTRASAIFAPFRTVGLVSPTPVPFTSVPLGKTTFQITTSVGRALQTYDLRRGLNLVFVTQPETPAEITATLAWRGKVFAAWGDARQPQQWPRVGDHGTKGAGAGAGAGAAGGARGPQSQGVWIFERGKKTAELELPPDLDQPVTQILAFGQWIVAAALTRIEVWQSTTLEHYTTIHTMAAAAADNHLTGGIATMPTFLNKIFVGRRDGWVEIWNVSTGKLIYTILPPSRDWGSVVCMEPSPALAHLAIAYSEGPLIIHDVLADRAVITVNAGSTLAPASSIAFRTDGAGAGPDGRRDGVMATATVGTGDVTFWDLNEGGRVMGVLRGAHNPPPRDRGGAGEPATVRGGISRVEFLPGQSIVVTSGQDNSLRTWIFDQSPFSPIPRMLHTRSGHAGPVSCLQFLPSDFDGAEAGSKWLLSGGQDRSLWGWSLRRDGQSTELSQGNMRKKAKKFGLMGAGPAAGSSGVTAAGPPTSLEDIKAPEITCLASSLNRDGGIGAIPGKLPIWQKGSVRGQRNDAEISGATGWESVVTGHRNDPYARTWFWGRKRAGRWALKTGDGANVSAVAVSACGTFGLVGSVGGSIDMYNLQSGLHRQRFPSRLTPAQARRAKMQQMRQAADAVVVQLISEAAGKFGSGVGKHTGAVTGIVVDSLNKFVMSCGRDGKVRFWDFLTGNLAHEIDWAPIAVTGCRYHATNDLMALSCDDGSIRVVDAETRRTIRALGGSRSGSGSGSVNDFCFSSDGRWIIAASQDSVIRIFDLPTSHLIDAIKLPSPALALAVSGTGEYLAAAIEGMMGVAIWTNKTMFRHVPTRQISEREAADAAEATVPTASGEGGQGLLEAALEGRPEKADGEGEEESEGLGLGPTVDQISREMMTLSVVPRSRWQTLVHLDLIKQRNKPKEAPKKPEQAPFFLPALKGKGDRVEGAKQQQQQDGEAGASRIITKLDRTRAEEAFRKMLRVGASTGNYDEFVEHLKTLPPSGADLELRSLSPARGEGEGDTDELVHFVRALTSRLTARRDYELVQAWMKVFLRLHGDAALENGDLAVELDRWQERQGRESARLDELMGYCSGVVAFMRSGRG